MSIVSCKACKVELTADKCTSRRYHASGRIRFEYRCMEIMECAVRVDKQLEVRLEESAKYPNHNHPTRVIYAENRGCPGCDAYHARSK